MTLVMSPLGRFKEIDYCLHARCRMTPADQLKNPFDSQGRGIDPFSVLRSENTQNSQSAFLGLRRSPFPTRLQVAPTISAATLS